jgi:hypothetical protein
MSNAKKCDRCGKLYELYDGCKVQKGGHSYNKVAFLRSWNDPCKEYDLCPECMELLIKWMKEDSND